MSQDLAQVVDSLKRMIRERQSVQHHEDILELTKIVENDPKPAVSKYITNNQETNSIASQQFTSNAEHVKISDNLSKYALNSHTKYGFLEEIIKEALNDWMQKNLPNMVRDLVNKEINQLISTEANVQKNSQF